MFDISVITDFRTSLMILMVPLSVQMHLFLVDIMPQKEREAPHFDTCAYFFS